MRTPPLLPAVLFLATLCSATGGRAQPSSLSPEEAEALRLSSREERLVQTPTRALAPLSQVAANMTVVGAEEILAMNAHTLAEVLNRVTGVFVQFSGSHFGAPALPHVQGSGETDFRQPGNRSEEHQVTLLVDGIPWNLLAGGEALVGTIPIGIIDRIEVIRGPASSTWGSALAGVIHVITKKPGTTRLPQGAASLSYGERRAYDGRAEAAGGLDGFGYYLYGQRQGAHWERGEVEYSAPSLFSKFELRPSKDVTVGLTLGVSKPRLENERNEGMPAYGEDSFEAAVGTVGVQARLSPAATLHVAGYQQKLRQVSRSEWDGTPFSGLTPAEGELLVGQTYDDRNRGAQAQLVYAGEGHTAVLGADYFHGSELSSYEAGPTLQALGRTPAFETTPTIERYGLFLNDTLRLGPLTLIPGLRYDDTSSTRPFWSPSFGATLRVGAASLVRASVARGFAAPGLSSLEGTVTMPGNADLRAERVWSYQAGLESVAFRFLWLKLTGFRHEIQESLETDAASGETVNGADARRTGFEIEAETAPVAGFSGKGGLAWVRVEQEGDDRDRDLYQANAGLAYRKGTLQAELLGHYVWWDLGPGSEEGNRNDFLWDLAASKTVAEVGPVSFDLFGTARNLFNGKQHTDDSLQNASRWVEGGCGCGFRTVRTAP